ncbi:MAG: UDP-glucose/GDP-mannose dehydrogenase family protein [Firmicutes bacterium]|nr:UDP-glucose/GDP-mannose dehydrogenase family protein [Bacillota bacterium]
MNITIIGCGYVGLVTAAGLAEFGHLVTAVDIDRIKIDLLNKGKIPIYEAGLKEIVKSNLAENRLVFTADQKKGIKNAQVIFIAVGTPPQKDGSADLSQVKAVAKEIAKNLDDYKVIVNKSTVPVGTGRLVQAIISENAVSGSDFDVVSNPEFLREGTALKDFLQPDRIVIGTQSLRGKTVMKAVYQKLERDKVPFVFTNLETAELIKYGSNAFLATKIAYINELARLCEKVNADVTIVAKGMGLDSRIGPKFLNVGPGYGGSCFPKDTKALVEIARPTGERLSIVEAVVAANESQKKLMFQKIKQAVGSLKGKTIAVLGLAFKADTDDIRESPAIPIVKRLLNAKAVVKVNDPKALTEAEKIFGNLVKYHDDIYETLEGTDAVVILTEWDIYRKLDLVKVKSLMNTPTLIDLRNIFTPNELRKVGFLYEGVGRGAIE